MPNITPTKQTLLLADALNKCGIQTILEYWDGHKHVDIYLSQSGMYIEVDGIQHFTNPSQILSDMQRNYYSNISNHHTFHVTNQLIETHLSEIVSALNILVNENNRIVK